MKVTFMHHSSFCVEWKDKAFIFDYFRGERIPEFTFQGEMPEFPADKEIYVFASHKHRDHFDMEIFRWKDKYPKMQYILPKDIKLSDNYLLKHGILPAVRESMHFMKNIDTLSLDGVEIKTFPSTDEGVAFLVEWEGKRFFHAGDLHWWHWQESDGIVNQYQEKTYKRQIDKLAEYDLDAAFVVLDERLGDAMFWGIDYFMRHVCAKYVFPMHLWQNYDLIRQYKSSEGTEEFCHRIVDVTGENQVWTGL